MAPNVRVWRHQFVYGFICGVLILSQLIAFDFFKGQGHSGDVMLALTFALVIRKPSYTPIWLVACAFFFADIMLSRPLGLWTLLVVLAVNLVRSNLGVFRDMNVAAEWANIAGIICVMVILEQAVLSVVGDHRILLGALVWHVGASIFAYGVVVFLLTYIFNIGKPASND